MGLCIFGPGAWKPELCILHCKMHNSDFQASGTKNREYAFYSVKCKFYWFWPEPRKCTRLEGSPDWLPKNAPDSKGPRDLLPNNSPDLKGLARTRHLARPLVTSKPLGPWTAGVVQTRCGHRLSASARDREVTG